MKILVVLNGANHEHVLCANLLRMYSEDVTFVDYDGLDDTVGTDEIFDTIDALTDATFDKAWILGTVSDTGGSETLNFDSYAEVFEKLTADAKGAILITGTAQTNATTNLCVLAATASASNDTYNNMVIKITAGAGSPATRRILDYTGASKTVEVGGSAFSAAPTTTSTYEIYDQAEITNLTGVNANGINIIGQLYVELYGETSVPVFIQFLSSGQNFQDYGTAAAIADTTITLQNATNAGRLCGSSKATNDYFNGMTVYVYSSTDGLYQKTEITDYVGSTRVATVDQWGITPSGTILYRVCAADKAHQAFWDVYCEMYAKAYITGHNDNDSLKALTDIIAKFGTDVAQLPTENFRKLQVEVLEKGKFAVDYLRQV
jgi:hypothetical protein